MIGERARLTVALLTGWSLYVLFWIGLAFRQPDVGFREAISSIVVLVPTVVATIAIPPLASRLRIVPGRVAPGLVTQVLLAFADAALPGKRSKQRFVRLAVERRELEPPFQVREGLVLRSTLREVLEDRGMAAAEAATLRGEPSAESRVAVDLETLEQLAPV